MNTTRSAIAGLFAMGLVWMSFSAVGCGRPTIRDVCVAVCECVSDAHCDPDDDAVEVCVMYGEAEQKAAREKGCEAEWDDKTACYGTDYQCPTPNGFCQEENDAFNACMSVSPPS